MYLTYILYTRIWIYMNVYASVSLTIIVPNFVYLISSSLAELQAHCVKKQVNYLVNMVSWEKVYIFELFHENTIY